MATYPSLRQYSGTTRAPRGGVLIRTATNGQSRPRTLASAVRKDPVIVHKNLTQAQWDTLQQFYDDNRGVEFQVDLRAEGVTVNAFFRDPPWSAPAVHKEASGVLYDVQVNLQQAD